MSEPEPADFQEDYEPGSLTAAAGEYPVVRPSQRSRWLLNYRAYLAGLLLTMLLILSVLLLCFATFGPTRSQGSVRAVAIIIFPPLTTLAGTAFAWFFASKDGPTD